VDTLYTVKRVQQINNRKNQISTSIGSILIPSRDQKEHPYDSVTLLWNGYADDLVLLLQRKLSLQNATIIPDNIIF